MWSRYPCSRIAIRHRGCSFVRLQGTSVIQNLCLRFLRASINPFAFRGPSPPQRSFLRQIQGGTEPVWSVRVYDQAWEATIFSPSSTVQHRPTQAQFSERDHARAIRASLLVGILLGLRMSAFCDLALETCIFLNVFLLVFVVFFGRLSVQNITHHMQTLAVKTPN